MVKEQHDQLKYRSSIIVDIVMISVVSICGHYVHIYRKSASSGLVTTTIYNHPAQHKGQGKLTVAASVL